MPKCKVIAKGDYIYQQKPGYIQVKKYIFVKEEGSKKLILRLHNYFTQTVEGVCLTVDRLDSSGNKLGTSKVDLGLLNGKPGSDFVPQEAITVEESCVDCRITVNSARYGEYEYAFDYKGTSTRDFVAADEKFDLSPYKAELKGRDVLVQERKMKVSALLCVLVCLLFLAAITLTYLQLKEFKRTQTGFLRYGVEYTFVDGDKSDGSAIYVSGYNGLYKDVSIPKSIAGHPVKQVDKKAFASNGSKMKSLVIEGSFAIEESTFKGCYRLQSVDMQDVSYIGAEAFKGCTALKSVYTTADFIGDRAFYGCSSLQSFTLGGESDEIVGIGESFLGQCAELDTVELKRYIKYPQNVAVLGGSAAVKNLALKDYGCKPFSETGLVLGDIFGETEATELENVEIEYMDTVPDEFLRGSKVKSVVIGNLKLPEIGDSAFRDCDRLIYVGLPDLVTKVGEYAFAGAALSDFNGSKLMQIGKSAFEDCENLVSIHAETNARLYDIGAAAFKDCKSLSYITVPSGVREIKEETFLNCENLQSVSIMGTNLNKIRQSAFKGCSLLSTFIMPASVTEIGDSAFADCTSLINIKLSGNLAKIGDGVFEGSSALPAVTLPSRITVLPERTFKGCANLSRITFEGALTELKEESLYNTGISSYIYPETLTTVGRGAFGGCKKLTSMDISFIGGTKDYSRYGSASVEDVYYFSYIFGADSRETGGSLVPDNLAEVKVFSYDSTNILLFYEAFRDCSGLKKVTVDSEDITALERPFYGCSSLSELTLPYIVRKDNQSSATMYYLFAANAELDKDNEEYFYNVKSLTKVTVTQEDIIAVADNAFYGCVNLLSFNLPQSVKLIGNSAFYGCRQLRYGGDIGENLTLPENLVTIGESSFSGCVNLRYVNLGEKILNLGNNAFENCYRLYEILNDSLYDETHTGYLSQAKVIDDSVFRVMYTSSNPPYKTVKDGYKFLKTEQESEYNGEYYLIDNPRENVLELPKTEFDYNIPVHAFRETDIESLTLSSSVVKAGAYLCYDCKELQTVTLNCNRLENILISSFEQCEKLTGIVIPASVATIERKAFYACSLMETAEFSPSGALTLIDKEAFCMCESLKNAILPSALLTIGEYAFNSCPALEVLSLGDSTYVGDYAFKDCTSLKIADFKNAVYLGKYSFNNCISLVGADIPSSIEKINEYTFTSCAALKTLSLSNNDGFCIDKYAFSDCASLTTVTGGEGVTELYECAFNNCTSLTGITFNSLTYSGNSAFYNCTSLKTAQINALSAISDDMFGGCRSLTVAGLDSAQTINENSFSGCVALTTVSGDCLTYVGDSAFNGCAALALINLQNVIAIESSAFNGCVLLENADLSSAQSIGDSAFYGCEKLSAANLKKVTIINASAFNGCKSLSYADIGSQSYVSNVTVGADAFKDCESLYKVILGSNSINVNIDYDAFSGCVNLHVVYSNQSITVGDEYLNGGVGKYAIGVYSYDIPDDYVAVISEGTKYACFNGDWVVAGAAKDVDTVKIGQFSHNGTVSEFRILQYAFNNNADVKSITVGGTVRGYGARPSVGDNAFTYASFESVSFNSVPEGYEQFSDDLFTGCSNITAVTLCEGFTSMAAYTFNGDVFGKVQTLNIPASMALPYEAFANNRSLTSVTFSSGFTALPDKAFNYASKLASVSFASTLISVGDSAFYGCGSLTDVTLGSGVEHIGAKAFFGCYSLTLISSGQSLKTVANEAFSGCIKLESFQLGSAIQTVGNSAFNNCRKLTSVSFGTSLVSVGASAFSLCHTLESVTFAASSAVINERAFADNASLTTLTFGSKIGEIKTAAFSNTFINALTLPSVIGGLGSEAFYGCANLKTLNAGGLTDIPERAFKNCGNLVSADLSNVKTVGEQAFYCCELMQSVKFSSLLIAIGDSAFLECSSLKALDLSSASTIAAQAFKNCAKLKSVKLPSTLISIGTQAFENCYALEAISLPSSVTSLGSRAFAGCTELKNAVLDSQITAVNTETFLYCTALTTVSFPSSLTSIGARAFYGCTSLSAVTLPASLQSVGSYAFGNCSKLALLTATGIKTINAHAFDNCVALKNVELSNCLTSIGESAFQNGLALTSLELSATLTTIGRNAFYGCTSLGRLTLKSDLYIDSYAFYNCEKLYTIYNLGGMSLTRATENNGYVAYYALDIFTDAAVQAEYVIYGDYVFKRLYGEWYLSRNKSSSVTYPVLPDSFEYNSATISKYKVDSDIFLFAMQYSMGYIVIPEAVTAINQNAFRTRNFTAVYYKSTQENWSAITGAASAINGAHVYYYVSCIHSATGSYWMYYNGVITTSYQENVENVEATCTENGAINHKCARCGEILTQEIIHATGHNYEGGECTRCHEPDPDYVPPDPPDPSSGD